MNYSMGLVSLILITIIFAPFFYAGFSGNSHAKKLKKIFKNEVAKQGYNLNHMEFWGNTFIGLDLKKSKLIYMSVINSELFKKEILINSIKDCNVVKKIYNHKKNGKVQTQLVSVDLELTFKNYNEPVTLLNFYNRDNFYTENHELKRAEKWKSLLLQHRTDLFSTLRPAS